MNSKKRLLIFILISIIIHLSFFYLSKPDIFLFSSFQNIKPKTEKITKVKLIKIKPKPKLKLKPKQKPKQKQKSIHKSLSKSKSRPKLKKTKIKPKHKLKVKPKSKIKKKSTSRTKSKKIDLSVIRKKVIALKKKEEEERIKQELKKEAAVFYANKLISLVKRLWIFPKSIPDEELPFLEIKIKLRVRKDGKIIGEPVIISKSKNKIFNESALRAVKKLYKYKIPLPKIIDDEYIDIILTLTPPER